MRKNKLINKFKIFFLTILSLFSREAYSAWNRVPDQTIHINAKYDQASSEIYDITATGVDFIEAFLVEGNQIQLTHSRDGYKGMQVPVNTIYRYDRRNFVNARKTTLIGVGSKESFSVDIGEGNSSILGIPTIDVIENGDTGNGCRIEDSWHGHGSPYNIVAIKTNKRYQSDWCQARSAEVGFNFTFPLQGAEIGTITKFFKIPLEQINRLPLGDYVGSYQSSPDSDTIWDNQLGYGHEKYTYIITLDMKPSINSFTVDNENLAFSVNRQSERILGRTQTGFNIRGNFHNSQSFELTFSSLNNALCSGSLCMSNISAGTVLPYAVKVLDPSSLQEKIVSRSGQKVTIDADKNYQLSSGLFFEFDSNNTALSGSFKDVVTVRVELKLM